MTDLQTFVNRLVTAENKLIRYRDRIAELERKFELKGRSKVETDDGIVVRN